MHLVTNLYPYGLYQFMGHSSSPQPFRVQATLELVLFPLGKATNAHERGKIIFPLQDGLLTGSLDCIVSPNSLGGLM